MLHNTEMSTKRQQYKHSNVSNGVNASATLEGRGRHQGAPARNKKNSPLSILRQRWPSRERRESLRSLCKTIGITFKRKRMRK